MTKPKTWTIPRKIPWLPIVQICIELLVKEAPRTDNRSERSKIRIKLPKSYKVPARLPKCVMLPCDDEAYEIREYRAFTLLDWLFLQGISQYSSKDVYSKRRGVLKSLHNQCKEIGLPGLFDDEE